MNEYWTTSTTFGNVEVNYIIIGKGNIYGYEQEIY